MFVKFKVLWQDGLYQYTPGKIVDLPTDLALRYCDSGKAEPANTPKWAMPVEVNGRKKKNIPSARARIKKIHSKPKDAGSLRDLANEVMGD